MIHRFSDGSWIKTKDGLTVREYRLVKDGRVLEALPSFILEWSDDKEINTKNCSGLTPDNVTEIIAAGEKRQKLISSRSSEELELIIKNNLKGIRVPVDLRFEELYELALMCTDHRGNITVLPDSGGFLNQQVDFFMYIQVFRKVRSAESKNGGGPNE